MDRYVSIIICTRNRRQSLARCLQALDQTAINAAQGEVVLVDNASEDDTLSVMYAFWEQAGCAVQVVLEPRAGLSHARNTGLGHAGGKLFVFLDDDCYFGEKYLPYTVQAFSSGTFDYAGGRILNFDPTDSLYGTNRDEKFALTPAHSFVPAGRFQGANFVMTRRLWEKVGPYDTELGPGTRFRCEDIDYCARASAAGFAGAHLPQLIIYHHHGRKPGADRDELEKSNALAAGAYYAKHIWERRFHFLPAWLKTFRGTPKRAFAWQMAGAARLVSHRAGASWQRRFGKPLQRLLHPRKCRALCVGTARAGTTAIHAFAEAKLHSAIDPDETEFTEAILASEFGTSTRAQTIDYLRKRDRRLHLELECSTLNIHMLPIIVEIFPKAKFILPIRDCVSWLEAEINYFLANPISRQARTLADYRYNASGNQYAPEEKPLEDAGLYTLDGYFNYWNWHNATALRVIPPHRLFIVKTRELGHAAPRLADFLGLNHSYFDAGRMPKLAREQKFDLALLPADFIRRKAIQHCQEVMSKIFQKTWAELTAAAAAAALANPRSVVKS